jgi:hypothetical protein
MNTRATITLVSTLLAAAAITATGTTAATAATSTTTKTTSSKSTKSTKSTAKKTTAKPAEPVAPVAPVAAEPVVATTGSHWMTPKAVQLRPTTETETQANAVWNLRAALNIAALQCQYLPQLQTVATYNAILRQHAAELDGARLKMLAHFKRYDGAKAQTSFDQYTTRTYNSYSTLDAQKAFCDATAKAGQEVLALPPGSLAEAAPRLVPEIRFALAEPVKAAPAAAALPDPAAAPAQPVAAPVK